MAVTVTVGLLHSTRPGRVECNGGRPPRAGSHGAPGDAMMQHILLPARPGVSDSESVGAAAGGVARPVQVRWLDGLTSLVPCLARVSKWRRADSAPGRSAAANR